MKLTWEIALRSQELDFINYRNKAYCRSIAGRKITLVTGPGEGADRLAAFL